MTYKGVVLFHHNQGIIYQSYARYLEIYKPIDPCGPILEAPSYVPIETQVDLMAYLGPYHKDPYHGNLGVWVPIGIVDHAKPLLDSGYYPTMFEDVPESALEYEEQEFFIKFHLPR